MTVDYNMQIDKVYQLDQHNPESRIKIVSWIFRDLKYRIYVREKQLEISMGFKITGKSTGRIPIT